MPHLLPLTSSSHAIFQKGAQGEGEVYNLFHLPPGQSVRKVGTEFSPLGQWVTHTPRSVLGSTPPYHQLNPGQRDGHRGGHERRQGLGGVVVMSGADWRSAEEGRICCCDGNKSLSCRK